MEDLITLLIQSEIIGFKELYLFVFVCFSSIALATSSKIQRLALDTNWYKIWVASGCVIYWIF